MCFSGSYATRLLHPVGHFFLFGFMGMKRIYMRFNDRRITEMQENFRDSYIMRFLHPVMFLLLFFIVTNYKYMRFSDLGITEFHVLLRFLCNDVVASSDLFVFMGAKNT